MIYYGDRYSTSTTSSTTDYRYASSMFDIDVKRVKKNIDTLKQKIKKVVEEEVQPQVFHFNIEDLVI